MSLIFRQLNPHACRTYLAGEEGSGEAVIIDPVLDHVDAYLELLEKEKITLTHTIDTHSHADHISGAAVLRDHTGCEYVMHGAAPSQCITLRINGDTDWNIGDTLIKIMHTPGHTKDSISLVLPDRILTGDVLLLDEGGAGRDDLPGGDPGEHWESLQLKRTKGTAATCLKNMV